MDSGGEREDDKVFITLLLYLLINGLVGCLSTVVVH